MDWAHLGKASRRAVEVGERMADGPVDEPHRQNVVRAAIEAVMRQPEMCGERYFAADRAYRVAINDGWYAVEWTIGNGPELSGGSRMVREIVGNPFRPVAVERGWVTPGVQELAQAVYDTEEFGRMPMLGDALEAAGCGEASLLEHCRGRYEHVRGCWTVDAILAMS